MIDKVEPKGEYLFDVGALGRSKAGFHNVLMVYGRRSRSVGVSCYTSHLRVQQLRPLLSCTMNEARHDEESWSFNQPKR